MEYWDNKGQIYNDSIKLSPLEKAYNKVLSTGMKWGDWVNDTNPGNDVYKQKIDATIALETLPFAYAKGAEYAPYLKDIWYGKNLIFDRLFPDLDKIKQDGEQFYQSFLQKTPANIKGYGEVKFSRHNKGKDKTIDFLEFPFLRKNLESSNKFKTTNYKEEPDRVYDHFNNVNSAYDYVIENIDKVGKRYKMMHKK